ncbi:RNA-directed DNA polymerase [Pectobacterium aroidearum]|uniref:reverse transcriptase family protein n=1 Tax=Pectobacterium aroidearum TaxID=1201031 RepID=UPI0015F4A95E|nr:reverse transcriptase family protein [Pectobacterium aroidearum]MBA5600807.1 RNA-directed DNA polymerase [Pectobacterium aroidearum]
MPSDIAINKSDSGISTLQSLAKTLGFSLQELQEIQSIPLDKRYQKLEKPKVDGTKRIVYKPHHKLKRLQRRINSRIFRELVVWPDFLYGSIPGDNDEDDLIKRDYVNCASQHCAAKSILKVDIKNFFDNIHKDLVRSIFENFLHINSDALDYLVDVCCMGDFIVQGALTSSYIASLCLYDVETKVVRRARRKKLVYTRLVDDITVSSKIYDFDFSQIKKHIEDMLADKDLPLNQEKTGVFQTSTKPLTVHGLRVDHSKPRLPSDEVKKIRSSLHNLVINSKKNNNKTTAAYRVEYNRCMGKINKLGRVGHEKHEQFMLKIKSIRPMPSKRDIIECNKKITTLEKLFKAGLSSHESYKRKFYLVSHQISIVKRSNAYKNIADELRERLSKVKINEN